MSQFNAEQTVHASTRRERGGAMIAAVMEAGPKDGEVMNLPRLQHEVVFAVSAAMAEIFTAEPDEPRPTWSEARYRRAKRLDDRGQHIYEYVPEGRP